MPILRSSTPAAFSIARKRNPSPPSAPRSPRTAKSIVTGCMGAEPEQITRLPTRTSLAITGPQQYESVLAAVHRRRAGAARSLYVDLIPPEGIKLTPRHYAYLKISEGCDNRCTFCIIPKLRGDLVSRPAAEVLREAERLVAAGVKELLGHLAGHQRPTASTCATPRANGASQRSSGANSSISRARSATLGVWVRLHYVYPYPHVDEVIALMNGRQSAPLPRRAIPARFSPAVLKRDAPPCGNQEKTLATHPAPGAPFCPSLTIRSTFIVGFPGETEEDFSPAARVARRSRARPGRLLPLRAGRRRCARTTSALRRYPHRSKRSAGTV
jgi:ribosomal protein S12 methylthiotransferase